MQQSKLRRPSIIATSAELSEALVSRVYGAFTSVPNIWILHDLIQVAQDYYATFGPGAVSVTFDNPEQANNAVRQIEGLRSTQQVEGNSPGLMFKYNRCKDLPDNDPVKIAVNTYDPQTSYILIITVNDVGLSGRISSMRSYIIPHEEVLKVDQVRKRLRKDSRKYRTLKPIPGLMVSRPVHNPSYGAGFGAPPVQAIDLTQEITGEIQTDASSYTQSYTQSSAPSYTQSEMYNIIHKHMLELEQNNY